MTPKDAKEMAKSEPETSCAAGNFQTGPTSTHDPIDVACMATAERCSEIMEVAFADAPPDGWKIVLRAKREMEDEFKFGKLRQERSNPSMGDPGGDRVLGRFLKENVKMRAIIQAFKKSERIAPGGRSFDPAKIFDVWKMIVEMDQADLSPERQRKVHGVNCPKVFHDPARTGYLHDDSDDSPYSVDGVDYCGRCHMGMDS